MFSVSVDQVIFLLGGQWPFATMTEHTMDGQLNLEKADTYILPPSHSTLHYVTAERMAVALKEYGEG